MRFDSAAFHHPKADPMARPKKAADRQGHRTKAELVAVPEDGDGIIPEPSDLVLEAGPDTVALWNELWQIGAGHYHSRYDYGAIEQYVVGVARRHSWIKALEKDGHVTRGSMNQLVAHPLVSQLNALEKSLSAMRKELGLNPEARARLNMKIETHERSALEKFQDKYT